MVLSILNFLADWQSWVQKQDRAVSSKCNLIISPVLSIRTIKGKKYYAVPVL